MKLFSGLFSKKAPSIQPIATKSYSIPGNSFLSFALGERSITASDAFEFYRASSAVATAVDMIMDQVEQIEPVLEGPDGKLVKQHPLLDLLRQPNPFETYRKFIGRAGRHWLLTHRDYTYLEGNTSSAPINLWSVSPTTVSPVESAGDRYAESLIVTTGPAEGEYKRKEEKRKARYFANPLKELTQNIGFSSSDAQCFADSPLQAAAQEVNQQIKGKVHNVKLLENGGRLSMIVTFKDSLGDDEHKQRVEDIKSAFGGSGNAGKIAVVSGDDMSIEQTGTSNKDMDYVELDKLSALAIYMRYRIPLPLVTNDAATFNNVEQATLSFYDNAVLPTVNILFEGLSNALLERFKVDSKKWKITYDPEAITALRGRMLQELKIRKDLAIETVNELRQLLPDRESLEGGDTLYQAANQVPLGTDVYTQDADKAKGRIDAGS